MKIAITGYQGRIGKELLALGCAPLRCNVLDHDETQAEIEKVKPDVIINCAGKSSVDWVCESNQNYKTAWKLAGRGTVNLQVKGVGLISLSSEYIFNGKRGKYKENDKPNPINDYGIIKLAMEALTVVWGGKVVRLSNCFGNDLHSVNNPPTFIFRSYAHRKHIAEGLLYIAQNYAKMPEVLNLAGTEVLSMYEFHLAAADVLGVDKKSIIPRKKEIPGFAPRPHKGGLNVSLARKLGVPLYSAHDGLKCLSR